MRLCWRLDSYRFGCWGREVSGLVSVNVINQWWIARRGTVMGISGFCVALLGLGLFPVGVNALIPQLGWRGAYMAIGVLLLLGMLPVGWLFFRDRPEQFGLLPDGQDHANSDNSKSAPPTEENWTLAEAIRTPAFWVVAGSAGTVSMLTTGLIFHLVSIFADQGLDSNTAASVFIPLSITMALVNLGGGMLADRLPIRLILVATLVCLSIGLLMAVYLQSPGLILLYGMLLGATSGFYRVIMSVVWANYFGRLHLGSIMGAVQTIAVGGAALGPMPIGIARDALGSYDTVLMWFVLLPVLFGIANLFVGRPVRSTAL